MREVFVSLTWVWSGLAFSCGRRTHSRRPRASRGRRSPPRTSSAPDGPCRSRTNWRLLRIRVVRRQIGENLFTNLQTTQVNFLKIEFNTMTTKILFFFSDAYLLIVSNCRSVAPTTAQGRRDSISDLFGLMYRWLVSASWYRLNSSIQSIITSLK